VKRFILQINFNRNLFAKAILALLFLVISNYAMNAQEMEHKPVASITGKIIDSVSLLPVEYASISLLNQADDKVVNGTTTNDKGEFTIEEVAMGTYKMQVYFIGYKMGLKQNIVVSKPGEALSIGDDKMSTTLKMLKEITVSSEKSLIENKIDKMVYNAEKDVTSQGGVATDMLKKIPQVAVDADGNVELQGNSNIRFLINGKPSTLFGNSVADVLQAIPANQIQSIEVITSPGAKYDAEGTGGIINIILKKSTAQGFNGNLSLSAGTRLENGSFNINARKGKFGVNAFVSGNTLLPATTINEMNRTSTDKALMQNTSLVQTGTSQFTRTSEQAGMGIDWELNSKNNITANFNYMYFAYNSDGSNDRQTQVKDAAGNVLSTSNDQLKYITKNNMYSYDWGANYKRTFEKEGQELSLNYSSSSGHNVSDYQQSAKYISPDSVYSGTNGHNPFQNKETNIELNYTHPLTKDFIIETGAKTVMNTITSDAQLFFLQPPTDNYVLNDAQSLSLTYHRNIYAGYLSATFKLFKWLDAKAGCRYEYTMADATYSNSGTHTFSPYATGAPSLVLSHNFEKNQSLKISYSHRIQRPDYRDLNPFKNTSDPKNITTGNADLRPEVTDKVELTYTKSFDKGMSINVALFYRGNKDDIQSYVTYYSNYAINDSVYHNVAVTSRENVGREDNYGLNVYGSIPIVEKLNVRTNISCFQRYIYNGGLAGSNVQGFNYRINANASYEASSTLIIEAFANFNSPRVNVQGKMPSFSTYSFALRKQFFNKKASLALTANNPFTKYVNQRTELEGDNFSLYTLRALPYRSFGINFTYKFGKMEFKKSHDEEENAPQGGG